VPAGDRQGVQPRRPSSCAMPAAWTRPAGAENNRCPICRLVRPFPAPRRKPEANARDRRGAPGLGAGGPSRSAAYCSPAAPVLLRPNDLLAEALRGPLPGRQLAVQPGLCMAPAIRLPIEVSSRTSRFGYVPPEAGVMPIRRLGAGLPVSGQPGKARGCERGAGASWQRATWLLDCSRSLCWPRAVHPVPAVPGCLCAARGRPHRGKSRAARPACTPCHRGSTRSST
jgi:hypothetical protein